VTDAALTPPAPSARRRRALPASLGYAVATFVIGLGLFASVVPSPLYQRYLALWHFSALTLTLIYATYAFGVLAALLLAGRVSDDVGRRPVLLAALGSLAASTLLFVFAGSPAWLFVARGLQGVATGAALSSASAAMLDLHPRRDPVGVSVANGVASAGGIGLGILTSSVLVQFGSAPLVLPYVVLLALFAVALAGAYVMPEPVAGRGRLRLTVERPRIPAVVRRPFLLAGLAAVSSWSIGGLFFSLGPELGAHLFHSSDAVLSGIGIVALAATAAAAQLTFGRAAAWLATAAGSVALAAGVLLIVLASAVGSSTVYLVGSVVDGVGFGMAFLGGLRGLVAAIPPEHRAAVMSAFYVVAYASLSLPAVLAGLVVGRLGLTTTFEAFGAAGAATALLVAVLAWRTRPARRSEDRRGIGAGGRQRRRIDPNATLLRTVTRAGRPR
jgi:MFS family permease